MADEPYWAYHSATPTPGYTSAIRAGAVNPDTMSERDWLSLTPGMRREIVRDAERRNRAPVKPIFDDEEEPA